MSRVETCECPSPAHCLEATGGEQGLTADELEVARLRRELAEVTKDRDAVRVELETRWCAEVEHANSWCVRARTAESERDEARARCRTAAQILIEAIGASGPESVEETARRAVATLEAWRYKAETTSEALEIERGQKKADLLQDLAELTVALRDLINSVEATRCRDTIVLRDIEAARALIGEGRS